MSELVKAALAKLDSLSLPRHDDHLLAVIDDAAKHVKVNPAAKRTAKKNNQT